MLLVSQASGLLTFVSIELTDGDLYEYAMCQRLRMAHSSNEESKPLVVYRNTLFANDQKDDKESVIETYSWEVETQNDNKSSQASTSEYETAPSKSSRKASCPKKPLPPIPKDDDPPQALYKQPNGPVSQIPRNSFEVKLRRSSSKPFVTTKLRGIFKQIKNSLKSNVSGQGDFHPDTRPGEQRRAVDVVDLISQYSHSNPSRRGTSLTSSPRSHETHESISWPEGTLSRKNAVHGQGKTFVKGDVIGKGSFGSVFRAFDIKRSRVIAVKELHIRGKKLLLRGDSRSIRREQVKGHVYLPTMQRCG
jgi:hypothetical protein